MFRLRDLIRQIRGLLCALLALVAVSSTSHAQAPAVLEGITLITQDDTEAVFLLKFSSSQPKVETARLEPEMITLLLRGALRSPQVPGSFRYRGLVRAVEFQSERADLAMRFRTAVSARVSVEPAEANTLFVRLKTASAEDVADRETSETGYETEGRPPASLAPAPPAEGERYEMIPLRYADVSEVIGLLVEGTSIEPNNIFIRREPGFGSLGANSQSSFLQPQSQEQRRPASLGQSFGNGLAIDRRLNAIWVTGTAEKIERVRQQIALIDIPVDSVILETQFVELTETGARNLGIDLNNNAGQIAVGRIETGASLPFNVNPNDVLPTGVMQAAIYAQVEKGEGRILSRPRIAAQSGSTAKIITGDALPILTAITLSGVNGVSQQVQYVNVGVTLQIAPRVSTDGFVTSQIYGVVSSVTGYSQGYPTISQREAETSASVRDGETFVIGGLTQENLITRKSRVPLLGDIPVLGAAFRQERATRSKTELYIVITPRIVRHRRFTETAARDAEAVEPSQDRPAGSIDPSRVD